MERRRTGHLPRLHLWRDQQEYAFSDFHPLFDLTTHPGGGKGRAAFCFAPPVAPEKRKGTDYSEYPLTPHGEMLFSLVQSGIASFPNRTVSLQFFEAVSRYTDFFKVRRECIIPTLEAMVDQRYVGR